MYYTSMKINRRLSVGTYQSIFSISDLFSLQSSHQTSSFRQSTVKFKQISSRFQTSVSPCGLQNSLGMRYIAIHTDCKVQITPTILVQCGEP